MSPNESQSIFLDKLRDANDLRGLFEHLPGVFFFAKDQDGRFVMANELFVRQCGLNREEALIGRTDMDFFPRDRALLYRQDDERVIRSNRPLVNRVELAPETDGSTNWVATTKIPLHDREGQVAGLAGVARQLHRTQAPPHALKDLAPVVEHLRAHYREPTDIQALAGMAGMSLSRFERRFKHLFHMTPTRYIQQLRISLACRLLAETLDSIARIAQDSGFYDHSHFTRVFRRQMGLPPLRYRKLRQAG